MKQGKLTSVVAVRKGSQRIPNKNIKPFGDSNLLEMKLNILKEVPDIDEIIVNSDCDDMLAIGEKYGCSTHKREAHYASSIVNNSDFHKHIVILIKYIVISINYIVISITKLLGWFETTSIDYFKLLIIYY